MGRCGEAAQAPSSVWSPLALAHPLAAPLPRFLWGALPRADSETDPERAKGLHLKRSLCWRLQDPARPGVCARLHRGGCVCVIFVQLLPVMCTIDLFCEEILCGTDLMWRFAELRTLQKN